MEYIKFIGAVLVVFAGAGFGACPVHKMKERTREMEGLYFCLLRLKSEINHAVKPLPEAIKSVTKNGNGTYIKVLENVASEMEKGGKSYESLLSECAELYFTGSVITREEQEAFKETFLLLGGGDRERQIQALEYYAEVIRNAMAQEKQKKKERSYLYRSLGVLGGIFLSVIMY